MRLKNNVPQARDTEGRLVFPPINRAAPRRAKNYRFALTVCTSEEKCWVIHLYKIFRRFFILGELGVSQQGVMMTAVMYVRIDSSRYRGVKTNLNAN